MEVAKSAGLVFSSTKCSINQSSISFFGNVYSAAGIGPDPTKVKTSTRCQCPKTETTYNDFSEWWHTWGIHPKSQPAVINLTGSLTKGCSVRMVWRPPDGIRHPKRCHHHGCKHGLLRCNQADHTWGWRIAEGSRRCTGSVEKTIAFASKTLTKTQSNCSNIEREMVSLVLGVERFHTYLYGRSFTIITDHKPLEMICNKPIASAPPRLQMMLVNIHGYDYSVKYRPGNEMIMSDVLSRLPNPSERSEVLLDLKVDELSLDRPGKLQPNQAARITWRNPSLPDSKRVGWGCVPGMTR